MTWSLTWTVKERRSLGTESVEPVEIRRNKEVNFLFRNSRTKSGRRVRKTERAYAMDVRYSSLTLIAQDSEVLYFMNFYLLVSGYDINTIYGSFFYNIFNA